MRALRLVIAIIGLTTLGFVLSGCQAPSVTIKPVPLSDIPAPVMQTFYRLHPNPEIIQTETHMVGDTLIYYIHFRRPNGSLRATGIKPNGRIIGEYEVMETKTKSAP